MSGSSTGARSRRRFRRGRHAKLAQKGDRSRQRSAPGGRPPATRATLLRPPGSRLAANVRLSNDPRPAVPKGLGYLGQQAAAMKPDPTTLVKLRDQALGFLSMRDVEARPDDPDSPRGRSMGFDLHAPTASGSPASPTRGDLGIWDIARQEPVDTRPTVASSARAGCGRRTAGGWWRRWWRWLGARPDRRYPDRVGRRPGRRHRSRWRQHRLLRPGLVQGHRSETAVDERAGMSYGLARLAATADVS